MIKGFIFDLDGVITDTAEYHYLAWRELANKLGISIDRKFNEQLKGISRTDSLEKILNYGGKSQTYSEAEKNELADEKNKEYQKLIQSITPADLLPGMAEFLAEIKAANLKLGLASASKNGPFILERLGIANLFDTVVDPESLKKGKPDPEIFTKGAKQLDLTISDCVGIEDAEAGIESINAAGMFSVGVGSPEAMRFADIYVAKTAELNLEMIQKQIKS